MARPRKAEVTADVEIKLPVELIAWLNAKFYDPRTGRPKYGARSQLIERLLREERRREEQQSPFSLLTQ